MSLTLGAADTITGVAGSATAITYTIFGDEIAGTPPADTFKVLTQGQLPASVGTLYTVPAATMVIVKNIHLVNGTGGSVTARLNVKGTAAANAILPAITILAGGFAIFGDDGWNVYNDQGQLLSVGATGPTGGAGADGADGADGVGIPVGGVAAQRLAKIDGADYNTEWVTPSDAITEITAIPTAEMDDTLVLAPDGAGGVGFRAEAGGGGATIKRPPLKAATLHATYGDDFAASTLDGKWSAHSTSGTFTTSHVQTQELDGSWVSLMFSGQNGRIYEAAPNTDMDVSCCMKAEWRLSGLSGQGKVGLAILDSSMNGEAVICYNDGTAYLMDITAGVLGSNSTLASAYGGINVIGASPVWLRITRVANSFTGYISFSGRAWGEGSATPARTNAITASRIAIGSFNDGAGLLTGRLLFEYVDLV